MQPAMCCLSRNHVPPLLSSTTDFLDIKPADMNNLNEVITAMHLHPSHSNILAYCSSRGLLKLCDLRVSAQCSDGSKTLVDSFGEGSKSFVDEICSSISDFK